VQVDGTIFILPALAGAVVIAAPSGASALAARVSPAS
jgi:hypothetical protein